MRNLLLLVLLATPTLAVAQPAKAPDVKKMATDDCARARAAGKTCVLSIEGESVEGAAPAAGDPPLGGLGFGRAASLIRLRRDFVVEILRTAEDLD